MSAHTLGPWIAADVFVNNSPNRLILRQAKYGGDVVADLGDTEHANMANARLIAAAPDLLAACIEATAIFDNYPQTQELVGTYQVLMSAIAKAGGAA